MPSIQIKNVPEDVHLELRRRAALAHQSLQEYLLSRLIEDSLESVPKHKSDWLEVLKAAACLTENKIVHAEFLRHLVAVPAGGRLRASDPFLTTLGELYRRNLIEQN